MKKIVLLGTTCVFLLAVFFINLGPANAASLPAPTATSISGDQVFTVKVISTSSLPGITTTSNGLVVPAGFPQGEKQFEGDALVLSDFSYGTVTTCFPVNAVNQGWGGKVGYWTGSAWKLLDTTITTPEESSFSWGCAKVYENGTYAFLKWITNSSLLPAEPVETNKPTCDFEVAMVVLDPSSPPQYFDDHIHFTDGNSFALMADENLAGRHIKVTFVSSEPVGTYLISGKSGNVLIADGVLSLIDTDIYVVPTVQSFTGDLYTSNETITYDLDFGSCRILFTGPLGF
jgi:hypothetical protein